mmetsp:Transcript_25315/g.68776  ORF Transcript_25315/g.68776 Transcript_25315/m.68776 type:complete len:211 (-) Transcript_25315:620-1252(-)
MVAEAEGTACLRSSGRWWLRRKWPGLAAAAESMTLNAVVAAAAAAAVGHDDADGAADGDGRKSHACHQCLKGRIEGKERTVCCCLGRRRCWHRDVGAGCCCECVWVMRARLLLHQFVLQCCMRAIGWGRARGRVMCGRLLLHQIVLRCCVQAVGWGKAKGLREGWQGCSHRSSSMACLLPRCSWACQSQSRRPPLPGSWPAHYSRGSPWP